MARVAKMHNQEVARIFFEMADILEMQNVQWKPQAYRRAAKVIATMAEDVEKIYARKGLKGLEDIPGVGKNMANKIVEYLKTGKIKAHEKLKASVSAKVGELMEVQGLGPKKIKKLNLMLGIKTIKDLEKAIREHKIAKLPGFGEKSEADLAEALKMKKEKRRPLQEVLPIAEHIVEELKKSQVVDKIDVAGSIRRKKETVRDIDILVATKNPSRVMDIFTSMPEVSKVLAKGPTKSAVILKNGIQADVRVVDKKSYGAALIYFTGSKEYNIRLREYAMKRGFKLSEYGLFDRKTGAFVVGATEEEIYKKLGLKYVKPEEREKWIF
ncbi:MAG: hypothetical protein K6T16_01890 [Candidatus Pacearchaeota archaeon]|nr:hypothetical protein [Candidatus Pacearchaeota archaeon]